MNTSLYSSSNKKDYERTDSLHFQISMFYSKSGICRQYCMTTWADSRHVCCIKKKKIKKKDYAASTETCFDSDEAESHRQIQDCGLSESRIIHSILKNFASNMTIYPISQCYFYTLTSVTWHVISLATC